MSGYDDFWDTGRTKPYPDPGPVRDVPGAYRIACRAGLALYACWSAYLAVWTVSSWTEAYMDPFAEFLECMGVSPAAACAGVMGLELAGFGVWMLFGAALLRLVLAAARKACRADRPVRQAPAWQKPLCIAWTLPHVLLFIGSVICSARLIGYLGQMSDAGGTGAGMMAAVFAGPILIVGACIMCGLCFANAALSFPAAMFVTGCVSDAWSGAR